MNVTITFVTLNKDRITIANALEAKLGRLPTHAEMVAEVARILSTVHDK